MGRGNRPLFLKLSAHRWAHLAAAIALTVGAGDFSAMFAGAWTPDRKLVITGGWRNRVDSNTLVSELDAFYHRHQATGAVADDDNPTKVFKDVVRSFGILKGRSVALSLLPMRGRDKETRASTLRGLFLSRRVLIVRRPGEQWPLDLVEELLDFPGGGTDDQVDALGLLARAMERVGAPPPEPEPPPIQPAVIMVNGVPHLNGPASEHFDDQPSGPGGAHAFD